ncbi:hypothetical protein Tco_0954657 [Tanacetum coccineum]|uniref:Uncharacterized protein n=1 Tax=Tanacetum coccineum TaxID=301880 RepID=A0ABQ5E4Z9_9ASTR
MSNLSNVASPNLEVLFYKTLQGGEVDECRIIHSDTCQKKLSVSFVTDTMTKSYPLSLRRFLENPKGFKTRLSFRESSQKTYKVKKSPNILSWDMEIGDLKSFSRQNSKEANMCSRMGPKDANMFSHLDSKERSTLQGLDLIIDLENQFGRRDYKKDLTLEESLSMFMAKITKRLDKNTNLIKELQASTDFALRNQKSLIKALEIQVRQMSIILHKKLSVNLQSSIEIKLRVNDETISTSVKDNKPLIRRINASQYVVSNLQNINLFSESKKTTLPSLNHLNDDCWNELKETGGEKDSEAYYTDAKPLGKALPRKEKDLGSFTLPCFIKNMCYKALADLGTSVSVMPYSTYTTLGLEDQLN